MEEFEQQLKSERKRIKNESREAYKKLLLQHKPIPELNLHSEEIDMGTHSVSVTELSAAELAKSNNWIGLNEVRFILLLSLFGKSYCIDINSSLLINV